MSTTTPNMNLIVPTVGVTLGPAYAVDVNNSLSLIDGHDHSPGYGTQVTPSGLNINADLQMQSNNLTVVRTVRFDPFASPSFPNDPTDLGALSVIDDDLYFTDVSGNLVQITLNGAVAGTPGSIANLVSPASAAYVSVSQKFVWQSNTNTAADMDFGSAILRNLTPSSFGLTLSPPTLSSNYTVTLPALPLGGLKILRMDVSGNMSATLDVDNSTLEIVSSVLRVKDLGITEAKIADNAVTTNKILDGAVTLAKLAPGIEFVEQQVFTSGGSFVVPTGCAFLQFTVIGGGGGGGGGGAGNTVNIGGGAGGGGGGQSQSVTKTVIPVDGETWTIVVGAGGTAGAAGIFNGGSGGDGGNGGDSSVSKAGMFLQSKGGNPGFGGSGAGAPGGAGSLGLNENTFTSISAAGGSAGGAGAAATYQLQGGGGGSRGVSGSFASGLGGNSLSALGGGNGSDNSGGGGGAGAGSAHGAGGPGGNGGIDSTSVPSAGTVGTGYGSGGGGGGGGALGASPFNGAAGGAGASGMVIVSYAVSV